MKIVFWQNIISPHQSAFFRALGAVKDLQVELYVENEFDSARSQMGWKVPDIDQVKITIKPTVSEIESVIKNNLTDTVHIFSGTRGYPMVWSAFQIAMKNSCKIGIMSESGDWTGLKGKLRLLRSQADALRINNKISFILAIGNKGVEWYSKSGYAKSKIYDWAYFIEPNTNEGTTNASVSNEAYQLLYVGKLVRTKGVDQLIKALKNEQANYNLTIIGDGPDKTAFKNLAIETGVDKNITWLPFIPNKEVRTYMEQADLFILPSTGKDGWGAVINEALLSGTPCLVSNFCGSSILMRNKLLGSTFSPNNIEEFSKLLNSRISQGKLSSKQRSEIIEWSSNLQATAAVSYFLKIISHSNKSENSNFEKPTAPWL